MALVASTRDKNDSRGSSGEFAVTSYVAGLSLASNESTAANIAKVLGELIKVLIDKGIIEGTVNS